MPGNFIVKAFQHPFLAGELVATDLTALPAGVVSTHLELKYAYRDLKPVVGAPYLVRYDDGTQSTGTLDARGEATIDHPPGPGKVFFGYDQRDAFPYPTRPANPMFGFKPASPEEAQAALERYAQAEAAYLEDHFFPDEVAAIYSGDADHDDLLSDYEYDEEIAIEEMDEGTPSTYDEIVLDDPHAGVAA